MAAAAHESRTAALLTSILLPHNLLYLFVLQSTLESFLASILWA